MVRGPGRRGSSATKRGKGRAKPVPSSPGEKRTRFQGRLSHRTPVQNQKAIDDYFIPSCPLQATNEKDLPVQTENAAAALRSSPRKQQPQVAATNGSNEHHVNGSCAAGVNGTSGTDDVASTNGCNGSPTNGVLTHMLNGHRPNTPHKIQLCDDLTNLSELSDLTVITGKKNTKTRARFIPSQSCNQQDIQASDAPPTAKVRVPEDKGTRGVVHPRTLSEKTENTCHKLTEYFPVRRSVRKTKKTVQEEQQRNLEDCVLSQKEDGLEVMNFEGKGRGVVTTRKFHRGEFVVEYCGELIDMGEAKTREDVYSQDQNTGCYMYYFKYKNNQYCIDATAETGRMGRLVNHSRNGNLTTKITNVRGAPRLVLIAKDDICAGQEVCYDYGDRTKESLKYHPWLAS